MNDKLERLVRWVLRKRGYLLIPFSELFAMEKDGRDYARAMKKQPTDEGRGYFNGLGDYASKTASKWRAKYLTPNNPAHEAAKGKV